MLFFDTSALLKRYVEESNSDWVNEIMVEDDHWAGSALLAGEAAISVGRGNNDSSAIAKNDMQLSRDLEFFDLVPVDADCLTRAIDIGRGFRVKTLDAIHLAAASTLTIDFDFITFDQRQREAAEILGLNVLAPPV